MEKIDRAIERALLGEKYNYFSELRDQYQKALLDVREHLKENPLLPLYENHIDSKVMVTDRGDVVMVERVLPSLSELREQAEYYGIDISDLGRSRTKIYDRLENRDEMVSSSKSTISKGKDQEKKAQSRSVPTNTNNTDVQENSQTESDDDFDFLDEIEDDPIPPKVERKLDQADELVEQSAEEKALIARMLALGSRGGKLSSMAERVNLDKLLEEETPTMGEDSDR